MKRVLYKRSNSNWIKLIVTLSIPIIGCWLFGFNISIWHFDNYGKRQWIEYLVAFEAAAVSYFVYYQKYLSYKDGEVSCPVSE